MRAIDNLLSLEFPRLFGGSVDVSEPSERCARWEVLGAFKVPKNDLDWSRECLGEPLGEGKYCGMAVIPGVGGSGPGSVSTAKVLGEVGLVGLVALLLES